ncbi:hypothetical protein ACH4TX_38960 [Streptomyces sp. NPDC021098]|uniref:hypothetical protein n=1 Tax=unclassified Streptomyces TaxID=2593676 RepID=UPI00379FCFB4
MFNERLENFSRERLGGRPIPDDLRTLLIAQWEKRQAFYEQFGIMFLEPGENDPLLEQSYRDERAPAAPTTASGVADRQMAQYLKVVAKHEDGACYGYWVHPDEPTDQPPRIVHRDSEGSFVLMGGKTFTEAIVEDYFSVPEQEFAEVSEYFSAEVAELLVELGIPVPTSSTADLDWPETLHDPDDIYAELYDAELERRGLK